MTKMQSISKLIYKGIFFFLIGLMILSGLGTYKVSEVRAQDAATETPTNASLPEPTPAPYMDSVESKTAQDNQVLQAQSITSDYSAQQWYLDQIHIKEAWQNPNYRGSSNIVVAILDTGVEYTSADLEDNMWTNMDEIPNDGIDNDMNGKVDDYRGWDFIDSGDNDPKPVSNGGIWWHGTAVAGIIGADHGDGGVDGINWRVKLMPIRVMTGDEGSFSNAGCG
jgi:subtilisin family serine protease